MAENTKKDKGKILKKIESGELGLVLVNSPGAIGCFYLVDKDRKIISLSPRNARGEIIGPKHKRSVNDQYWENVRHRSRGK